MPRRIELSRAALADFDDIYDYIARDNPRAAAQVLRSLDESIQLLADQPKLGKVFRHRRLRLRLLTHDDYLVFYRERPGVIEIVRVIHGRRNVPDILDEFGSPKMRPRGVLICFRKSCDFLPVGRLGRKCPTSIPPAQPGQLRY
jgi:toxin ParE1/3/4